MRDAGIRGQTFRSFSIRFRGTLRESLIKSSGGYVAVYAVGAAAVLVLLGDEGLDITRLHRESRAAVDSIEALLAEALLAEPPG